MYAPLKFKLYCTSTRLGETVKVTGNCPELGNWNPSNALSLCTNDDEFPMWHAGLFINFGRLDNGVLQYKYIIVP